MTLIAPEAVRAAYGGWRWTAMSEWPDQTTWRLEHPDHPPRYLKIVAGGHHPTVPDEVARTRWARDFLPVPEVVDCGSDGGRDWLVTLGLAGRPATDPALGDPRSIVRALAEGLRRFHDDAPVDDCPFDFRLNTAITHARRQVAAGVVDPVEDLHDEHRHLDLPAALAELDRLRPATEDLVVCHGDYCPPNILIADEGVAGYVDLGELGVADRWSDLAVATWATTWNFGPGHEGLFLDAYGAPGDPERQAFYRLLYDLAS